MLSEVTFLLSPPAKGGFYFMKITIKEIAEVAMLIALALILDMPLLKFKVGANGGSVSFTMVPLFVIAWRYGPIKSFLYIAFVYCGLSVLLDGEPIYSLPFDYCLAYGAIALSGLFRKQILTEKFTWKGVVFLVLSVVLVSVVRVLSHTISSILFYEVSFGAGLVYNLLYVGPCLGIVTAALLILYKPLIDINNRFPVKSI